MPLKTMTTLVVNSGYTEFELKVLENHDISYDLRLLDFWMN